MGWPPNKALKPTPSRARTATECLAGAALALRAPAPSIRARLNADVRPLSVRKVPGAQSADLGLTRLHSTYNVISHGFLNRYMAQPRQSRPHRR